MADADTAARHCSKALFRRRRTCACDDKDTTPAQQEKFRKKLASKQHAKTLAKHTRFQKELDQKVKESKAKPAYHRKGRRLLDADHSTELNCERLLGEGWSKPVPPSVAMPTIHGISTASGTPRKGRTLLARAGQSGSANTAGTCLRLLGEGWDSQPAGRSLLNTEISATTVQETCSGEERLGLEKLLREADEFQASFRTELMSNEQAAEESTEFGEDDADMDDTGDNYNGFSTFSTFAKQDMATSPQQQGRKLLGAQHEQKLGEGNAPRDTKAINTFDRRRRTADYERRRYVRRRASKQDRRRSNLPVTKDVRIPSLVCPCPPPGPDSEPDYLPTMAPAPPLGPPAGSARRRMVTKSRRRAPVVTEYDNEAICKREKYCKVQACQSARGGKSGKGGRGVGGGRKGT